MFLISHRLADPSRVPWAVPGAGERQAADPYRRNFFFCDATNWNDCAVWLSQVRTLVIGQHGLPGTVASVVHGEQQAGLPQEDPGQQAGGQAPVQVLPQHPETTLPGAVRPSLLLVLLQPGHQVSQRAKQTNKQRGAHLLRIY